MGRAKMGCIGIVTNQVSLTKLSLCDMETHKLRGCADGMFFVGQVQPPVQCRLCDEDLLYDGDALMWAGL